ncbi:gamma-tubulin complex component 3 [Agrilus planipennis]|uniref:Gamma-tubulin complex component 3 n=1 Tax=Agrilus planipennis TaxID=224129 RepID=A0A1W4XGV0_AGRPL|nr:gamma-tubulin complex component 3 [Agrilus planipennis]XP_018331580.1 gamma-tubulin complex component 3 [Agrilus planipennis]
MNPPTQSTIEDGSGIPALLKKLCNNFAKNNAEVSSHLLQTAFNFLNVSFSNNFCPLDEHYVITQIRKTLYSVSLDQVQNFDLLYTKLQKTSILKHKVAVLHFLLNMSNTSHPSTSYIHELHSIQSQSTSLKSQFIFLPDDGRSNIKRVYSGTLDTKPTRSSSAQLCKTLSASASDNHMQLSLWKDKSCSSLSSRSSSYTYIKETDLIQEVIYSLQGIEGRILRKEPGGVGFVIDPKMIKCIGIIQRGLVERLANVGFLHNQLKMYCDDADKQIGVIGQALMAVFREELMEYYKMVAILQAQLKGQNYADSSNLTLRRMIVWIADPLTKLQWLAYIADQCSDKKGGALISAVHGFLQHGSVSAQKISAKVLSAVCRPFYIMLCKWLLDGELNDPNGEFFIEARNITKAERLWHDKYHVKKQMVPTFISMDQAKKILATGKSINFLRQICQDNEQIPGREALQKLFTHTTAEVLFAPEQSIDLHSNLENAYCQTSLRVLNMLKDKFRLMEHLQAFRRYLLLGQGDFIRHLLELLAPELSRTAAELYGHTLTAILESAIRTTNAQYEEEDILKRINVGFMNHSHGDSGWDVFTLVYFLDGPMASIFEPAMADYKGLFGSLWKAKRMEFVLSNMRKQQISIAKLFKNMKELTSVMHLIHVLSSEMIHFLHQTQYYFLFEVLECSWAEMSKQVGQAECLDDVINAHSTFLKSVQSGVLLDTGINGHSELSSQLRIIYNLILHLGVVQDHLYERALKEHNLFSGKPQRNRKMKNNIKTAEDPEHNQRLSDFRMFLNTVKKQVKHTAHSYAQHIQIYLKTLSMSSDLNLQLLSVRLNFNDYYKVL